VSTTKCKPYLENWGTSNGKQAFWQMLGIGAQAGTMSRGQQKRFHADEATGMKVQREALCSSLSMKGSFTST